MDPIDLAFLLFGMLAASLAAAIAVEVVHIRREHRRDRADVLPRWLAHRVRRPF